ncbi:TolC family protein [Psychromonas sp. KJ10-10]|uniref:TolC family protein n=1 Tax=Psychromonas sp. KJ10-10 TaxID=3391823 RepID=UPI0039B5E8D3
MQATADASQWTAQASEQDRESTAQSLVVTVATLYWKIGYLNQRINLANLNIEGLQQVITLTKHRYENGSETRLAVLESTQSLYKQQVTYNELQQQLSEAKNALSILLNRPLEDALLKIDKLPEQALPDISAGIPADLLVRRPDIKATLYTLEVYFGESRCSCRKLLSNVNANGFTWYILFTTD